MDQFPPEWRDLKPTKGIRYTCGYCGTDTSPSEGWYSNVYNLGSDYQGYVLICTNCNRPSFVIIYTNSKTVFKVTPSAMMGKDVVGLPVDVEGLYEEARKCTSTGAYTATVLCCRKILMHIAVDKQATPNQNFLEYVEYLANKNYIPPDGRDWVDYLRTKSNEANHEINIMSKEDAEDLITFIEMLLRLVYEFKDRMSKKTVTP